MAERGLDTITISFGHRINPDTVYEKSVAATCEAVTVQNEVPTFPYSPIGMMPSYLADLLERSSKYLDKSQKIELVYFLIQFNQVFAQNKTDLGR
ncbi:hypothetical protein ACJMK2_018892 [Sinanodonta woodiana]|uniref:Uncharacterized protein n=1 Tax=Sinanodonta woodiana TaxID=1069815 RepID=A0ABD3UG75_SINWO